MDNQTAMDCRQQSIPADNVQPMESTEYEAPLLEDMDFSMFWASGGIPTGSKISETNPFPGWVE